MEVQVLGPLRVVDGDAVIEIGPKERVVLARLVAARGRAVPDDILLDVVWRDRPPPSARKTLQGYVHRIRRVLGASAIERTGSGYRLGSTVNVDVNVVDVMMTEARRAVDDGRLDEAATMFADAQDRFRGDALGELEDDAASCGVRRQLAELGLTVEEERLGTELERGNHAGVIGELETLLGADATRERAWCLLVIALAEHGRQADALDAIARAKRALALELGVEPGPRLAELERAVLDQRPAAALRPSAISRGMPQRAPTLRRTPAAKPSSPLPLWDTRFCGRSDDVARLVDRVPKTRIVVLTGPGGIGKTRLAATVAAELVARFADGVYFVELAGIVADAVDRVIAENVGVRREPKRTSLDSLAAWMADRDVLLVLDNCENVVDPVKRAAGILSRGCPGLRLLATSRRPLGVRGEVRVPVRPLDQAAALDLLMDRLSAANPFFDTESELDRVTELGERLDGVPLALELAAAQCRTMTPRELLVRLASRTGVLADRAGLFDERHRDLDELIAWSWQQLSPLARRVGARLTLVIGSFTLDTAEGVAADECDDLGVVRALEELEDSGLIVSEQTHGDARHRFLEPIRQHVAAGLDAAERDRSAHRHARWLGRLATEARAGGTGPDFAAWAALIERDLPNFRQAHRHFINVGDAAGAVDLVRGLSVISAERGILELADWCDSTIALVVGNDALELAAVSAAAPIWYFQNRIDELAAAADRLAAVDGDDADHIILQRWATQATLDPTRWEETVERLEQTLRRHGSAQHTWESATTVIWLVHLGGRDESDVESVVAPFHSPLFDAMFAFYRAVAAYMNERYESASRLVDDAVNLARQAGALVYLALALMCQGCWAAQRPGTTTADVFGPLVESLDLWEQLRIPWARVAIAEQSAQALAVRGHPEPAIVLWGAVDASGIQPVSKVARPRFVPFVANVPVEQTAALRSHGEAMSLDDTVNFARHVISTIPSRDRVTTRRPAAQLRGLKYPAGS